MRRQRSRDGPLRARIRNIWTSASRPPPGSREIEDTVRNVKFTSVTFIVTRTFSRCWAGRGRSVARARALAQSVWALFYDRKPSNADRFTRKRLFAPFRRACVRSSHSPSAITSPGDGSTREFVGILMYGSRDGASRITAFRSTIIGIGPIRPLPQRCFLVDPREPVNFQLT